MQFLLKHESTVIGYEATVGLQFDGLVRYATPYLHNEIDFEEFAEEFEHISEVKVKTIPQPILEIYKSIYNLG